MSNTRRPRAADHEADFVNDSTSRPTRAARVANLVALAFLIILYKFGFWELLRVVSFGFFRLLWLAVPALIIFLLMGMVVEWEFDGSEVACAPATTGRGGGGEGNDSRISREELANWGAVWKFNYKELEEATNSFASDLKLGEGASGTVYKGHIVKGEDREPVAVKILTSSIANQRISDFITEISAMTQLCHTNLVKLKGFCHELNVLVNPPVCEFALVYEFIGGGTLYDYLFKRRYFLTWENRYNIALGLASALHYLRKKKPLCVIHRDIKSKNVMLDEALVPKLGDFGTAKLVGHIEEPSTIHLAGTAGYWAPEYAGMGVLSRESDIYSFGVILLEIACGKKAVFSRGRGQARVKQNLQQWVRKKSARKELLKAVDSRLGGNFNRQQAKALMIMGLQCADPDASRRPSIEEAETYLKLNRN